MAKTHLLPLQVVFRDEPNTLRKRYQIVTKICPFGLAPVYTGAMFISLKGTARQ